MERRFFKTIGIIAALFASSCIRDLKTSEIESDNQAQASSSENDGLGSPTAQTSTNYWLLVEGRLEVDITCQRWPEMGYSLTLNAQGPLEWQTCADVLLPIDLGPGENFVKIWFRSDDRISESALGSYVVGDHFLTDPTPQQDEYFGGDVGCVLICQGQTYALDNGLIVVSNPEDSTKAPAAGAVHFISGKTGKIIRSFYGDQADDRLGGSAFGNQVSFVQLSNGNYLFLHPNADSESHPDTGVVILYNGQTHEEIARVEGDQPGDKFGHGKPNVLANGHVVIVSREDNTSTLTNAGSITLMDGATGAVISQIYGDQSENNLGSSSIVELPSGNFVIMSPNDDTASLTDSGSAILINGETGVEISRIEGNHSNDRQGSRIEILVNGNYVLHTPYENTDTLNDAGSAVLVDGVTGVEILRIEGTQSANSFGDNVKDLANGNYLILSPNDDTALLNNSGSVVLVNGSTGNEIVRFNGVVDNNRIGIIGANISVLSNGNFVIHNRFDSATFANAGSISLVNGVTGAIMYRVDGDQANNELGLGRVVELANGNIVVSSWRDDTATLTDNGSVILLDGSTGALIYKFEGDHTNDRLGGSYIEPLSNGNFLIGSGSDSSTTLSSVGSVILVNGTTGSIITRLEGEQAGDQFGSVEAKELPSGHLLIRSPNDGTATLTNSGSVVMLNGTTGAQIARIEGNHSNDKVGSKGFEILANGNFIIISDQDSTDSLTRSGSVILVNGSTGAEISRVEGDRDNDGLGSGGVLELPNGNFIIQTSTSDTAELTDAGSLIFVDGQSGVALQSYFGKSSGSLLGAGSPQLHPTENYIIAVEGGATVGGQSAAGLIRLIPYFD